MKSIKYISNVLVAVTLVAGLVSCSEEKEPEYTSATQVSGMQVFFAENVPSQYDLAEDATTFEIPISRVETAKAAIVPIEVTGDNEDGAFTFPSTVSFDAGQANSSIAVAYDPTKLVDENYGKYRNFTIQVAGEGNASPYSINTLEVKLGVPEPWTDWCATKADWEAAGNDAYAAWPLGASIGTCTYTYTQFFTVDDVGLPISYRQHKLDPEKGQFKIGNWGGGIDFIIDYNPATHDCQVLEQYIGYDHTTYGPVNISDITVWQEEDYYAYYPCTYDPETGKFVLNVVYTVAAGNFGYGEEYIQVDGYYIPDYTIEATCMGVLTDMTGEVSVLVDVTELGVDVEVAKAVVVEREADPAAVIDAVAAGELEATDLVLGLNKVALDSELNGELQVVIVGLAKNADGEDEPMAVKALKFEYYGGGGKNPWKSLGTGLWTDDILFPMFFVYTDKETGEKVPSDPVTYAVEIKESTETPGLYRIMDAYSNSVYPGAEDDCAEDGSYIEVNATDPEGVYIPVQDLGFDWGYGDFAICTYGGYLLQGYDFEDIKDAGYLGVNDGKKIKFPSFYRDPNDPSKGTFQGLLFMGEDGYYAGSNGKVEITLPAGMEEEAVKAARFSARMAKAKASARKAMAKGEKFQKDKQLFKRFPRTHLLKQVNL